MAETKTPAKKPPVATLPEKFNSIVREIKNGTEEALPLFLSDKGITFDVISEDGVQHSSFWQHTPEGTDQLVWVYESDLTVRWTNAEKPADKLDAMIHVIGTSNKGPATAKLAAWDSALATYFASKFWLPPLLKDPHAEDATNVKSTQRPTQSLAEPRNGSQGINTQEPAKNAPAAKNTARRTLTGPQMDRMYRKAEAAGITMQQVDAEIRSKYNAEDPHTITRQQYDEICRRLDDAARNRQGGQPNE